MHKNWRSSLAIGLVLVFGFLLFYFGTNGFQAFTAETARVMKLVENKPKFPNVTIEDSKGRIYPITDLNGKYVLITFMYTSCTTVCPILEWNMHQVYEQIPSQYIGEDIVFLSLSFDTERDDVATLEKYRTYFHSDGETWRMARIPNQEELDALLKSFGVIAIADGNGNFTHNSAFYVVDPKGTLIDVLDYTKVDEAAVRVNGILASGVGG